MRKWGMMTVMILLVAGGLAGCRLPGYSGYRELNDQEVSDLASMARGSLLRVKSKIRKNAKEAARPMLLQDRAAVEHVRTELPAYKIYYTGDYQGCAVFEWDYDGWVYQVQATGNLRGSMSQIHWSYSVKPPLRLSGENAEFWEGPDPDELLLYYSDDPEAEPRPPARREKLEFDLGPDRAPGISVEGAISEK